MIDRQHAPGCTYTMSSKARCTCHWAKVIAEEEARRPIPPEVLAMPIEESMTEKPITFTDEQGNEFCLRTFPGHTGKHGEFWRYGEGRDATPDDLARAGYTPSAENAEVQRLCLEAAKRTRELEALIAFERYFRATKRYVQHGGPFPAGSINDVLKAIDEARE